MLSSYRTTRISKIRINTTIQRKRESLILDFEPGCESKREKTQKRYIPG